MKRLLAVFMVLIMTILMLPVPTYANADVDSEEIIIGDAYDVDNGSDIEPFKTSLNDPMLNYSASNEGVYTDDPLENSDNNTVGGISTFNVSDTAQTTDLTLSLNGLTLNQLLSESNGSNFQNVVNWGNGTQTNRSYLLNEVQSKFEFEGEPYLTLQGMCNDGEYIYHAIYVADEYDGERTALGLCIVAGRYNQNNEFITEEITYSSELVEAGCLSSTDDFKHGNDLTYNSLRDQIVLACTQKGYHNVLYTMDADYFRNNTNDLPNITKHKVSCMLSNIAYSEFHNKYVGGVSDDTDYFVILDSDFNIIDGFNSDANTVLHTNAVRQAVCCDETYIYATYFLRGLSGTSETIMNALCVYDWKGNIVKEINLDIERVKNKNSLGFYEIEGITIMGDRFLTAFNSFFKKGTDENRVAYYYHYDLSPFFFSVKYCPDDTVSEHINNQDLKTQNILYGLSTKTYDNTYRKSGKKFDGWNLYAVASNKWRYCNSTGDYKWCVEDSEPSGYKKAVYDENTKVSKTVGVGNQVLLCAVWTDAENKFFVSFNPNRGEISGNGTVADQEVISGTSTPLNSNNFTKAGRSFEGWNAYCVEWGKWYYEDVDTGEKGWYREGEQPARNMKYRYSDGATVKKTVPIGCHVIFFAQWNEFTIYYDANGRLIDNISIKFPTVVAYPKDDEATGTDIEQYSTSSLHNHDAIVNNGNRNFAGFYQYRIEKELWRYYNESTSKAFWSSDSTHPLYTFTGSTVKKTASIGEHVKFIAKWN